MRRPFEEWALLRSAKSAHSSNSICFSCWVFSVGYNRPEKHSTHTLRHFNHCPIHSSDIFTFQQRSHRIFFPSKNTMWPSVIAHKVCTNGIWIQTQAEVDHLLIIAISSNSTSVENLKSSPPRSSLCLPWPQRSLSLMLILREVGTGFYTCLYLSPC